MSKLTEFDLLLKKFSVMKSGANTNCSAFSKLLEKLGFCIKDGRRGGHKIIFHPTLAATKSFNCGHRSTSTIDPVYIGEIYNFVKNNERVIKEYVNKQKSNI